LKIDASRTLLYETARFIDVYKEYEEIAKKRSLTPTERKEMKKNRKRAEVLTPLLKGISSEYCNQIVYDAVQIHGGTGFMRDFPVERLYRDARITSIYEGTTQLQVIAAAKGISGGIYKELIKEYQSVQIKPELEFLSKILKTMADEYYSTIKMVDDADDVEFTNFHSRRLVEMAANILMGYLLTFDADRETEYWFKSLAELFLKKAQSENRERFSYIRKSQIKDMSLYKKFAV